MSAMRTAVAAALCTSMIAQTASAALPSTHSLGRVAPTPSGVVNSKYRNGDDGTPAIPLLWGTCPAISLTEADTISYNLRSTCSLSEAGSPLATISIFSGTLPTGCVMADLTGADGINDGFTCTTPTAATASLVARATRNADTANSAAFSIAVTASGTDTTAPTIPLALTGADNANGTVTLTWEASSDPRVSGVATGVASYRIQKDGGTVATVTAPSANVQPALTEQLVGANDGKAYTQTGASHALTFGGTGLGATTDQFLARGASVTGDFIATAKITAYTPTSGTAGSIGIWAGASATSGTMYAAARWRDTDDKCNLRTRTSTGGTAANGTLSSAYTLPVWLKLTRVGDLFSAYCSSDGVSWTLTSSQTFGLGSSAIAGPFITSGSAGNTATGTVAEFNIHQASTVGTTYTGTSGSFTVSSYDGANRSAESTAAAVTITGGAASTLIAVPAATKTVCGSGCDFTPSQLSTIVSSAANASANGIAAGESIELRAAAAGGTETWSARIYCNAVSGTSGSPIWLAVRDGDRIILDTPTASGVGLLDMTDCDHWNIVGSRDGSMTGLQFADIETRHQPPAIHDNPPGYYANNRAVMIRSSTGVGLIGLTIGGGAYIESSLIDKDSDMILLKYVDAGRQGTNAYDFNNDGAITITPGSLSDEGDSDSGEVLKICASHVVIEDSYFHHSGHKMVHHCGPYHVLRRVKHNGDWTDLTNYPQYTGNHMATFQAQLNLTQWNTTTVFGPLVEDSLFYGVGSEPEHKLTNEGLQLQGKNLIFRGNYVIQRAGPDGYWGRFGPIMINACSNAGSIVTTDFAAYLQVYHNTLYGGAVTNNSASLPANTYTSTACAEWKVKNNLFQGQQYNVKFGSNALNEYVNTVVVTNPVVTATDDDGYANIWKGAEWMGNVFGKHPSDPVAEAFYRVTLAGKRHNTVTSGLATGSGSAALTDCATWPSNWCNNTNYQVTWNSSGTTAAVANLVNDAIPDASTMRAKLTPNAASYAAMGTALHLTTIDAVTDGTHVSLASARYFKDTWGITNTWGGVHTEYGDCIAVGATAGAAVAARITAINYTNGDITITPSRSISNGDKVWKATDVGDGTCGAIWDAPGAAQ